MKHYISAIVCTLWFISLVSSSIIKLDDDQAFVITTFQPLLDSPSSAESWEAGNSGSGVATENELSDDNIQSDEVSHVTREDEEKDAIPKHTLKPDLYSFKIYSDIKYRYARTQVTSKVVNPDSIKSQEVTFRVVLPETAFISKFIMEIDGVPYEAYVKEKEEAKKVYTQAQSQGQSAGLVELNTRNTNIFDVNVNVKAQSKINFNLTYEELLTRRLGVYEQSISITPDQITNVKEFEIIVNIEESQNITLLRVPNLRNDVDAPQDSEGNNKDAVIERPAANKANITWKPSTPDQSQLGKQELTGKFIVQYDIKRELEAGEVLVMNGYFVHFYAPENLKPLRKHVVFILDVSGSMWGRRMEQLKEAMQKILADLNADDYFNIFTFSSDVQLWSPEDKLATSPNSNWSPPPFHGEKVVTSVEDPRRRQPYPASPENIAKAQAFIQSLVASGGTNIHDSIVQALNLTTAIKLARDGPSRNSTESSNTTTIATPTYVGNILPANVESLVMFLTDGEPTVGITNPTQIQTFIQQANKNISVPIFSLAFGDGADFPFVRKLSLQNNGFARKIYEASDAALQLKGFYNEIASPLLSNVTFNYTTPESAYSVENITITKFPTVFGGTEIVVAGILAPKPEALESDPESLPTTTVPDQVFSDSVEILDEDSNQILPTDKKYFDVFIEGTGRDGHVSFKNPEVFSSPIPWGIPVVRPFPPRPTPPPTQDDKFLERLWAYLTIRQLIEKDLAEQSKENEIDEVPSVPSTTVQPLTSSTSNSTSIQNATAVKTPETPKQRALSLALKYGFVTSLTSLVVVKPNSSDITNTQAGDSKPDVADSLMAPQVLKLNKVSPLAHSGGAFTSNRIAAAPAIVPLSLSHQQHYHLQGPVGFAKPQNYPAYNFARPSTASYNNNYLLPSTGFIAPSRPSSFSTRPTQVYYTSEAPVVEAESEEENEAEIQTTLATATIDLEVTTVLFESENLTLSNLEWYHVGELLNVTFNGEQKSFQIAYNETSLPVEKECTIKSTGENGRCVHLKDCIKSDFANDYKLYTESYFCPIEDTSSGISYAGSCCA